MSKPTVIDDERALLYAFERSKLGMFNKYLKMFPQLFSHIGVEIRFNRNIPHPEFNKNIAVRLIGTQMFCSQAKCISTFPRGQSCSPDSEPRVFMSGNSTIEACQAACFSFFNGKKDEDGNFYKLPLVRFNQDAECCTMHNMLFFTQATDDYTRTDIHPTPRVDTIGTGFDLDNEIYKDGVDQTFKFKMNKFYCDDFRHELKGTECEPSLGEKLASLFASETLYKATQYGVRKIQTGKWINDVQNVELPPPSFKATPIEDWYSNVNPNAHFFNLDLTLSDLGITPDTSHLIFTTEFGWPGKLIEPTILYKEVIEERNNKRPAHLRFDSQCWRIFDEFEILGYVEILKKLNKSLKEEEENNKDEMDVTDPAFLDKVLRGILGSLSSSEFYTEQLPAMLVNEFASVLKRVVKYSAVKFDGVVLNSIRIAERTLVAEFAKTIGYGLMRGGKMLARLLTSTLKNITLVGMILDFVSLIDLFFLMGDVWGQQKYGGSQMVEEYSVMDLKVNEYQYGFKTFEFSPAVFIALYTNIMGDTVETLDEPIKEGVGVVLLSKEMYKYAIPSSAVGSGYTNIDMFKWQTDFFLHLENNSVGEPIIWEPVMNYETFEDKFNTLLSQPLTQYNPSFFEPFLKRKQLLLNITSIIIVLFILFLLFKSELLLLIIGLITILLFSIVFAPSL